MKKPFEYQLEFTGVSIIAMFALGYGVFGQDIAWVFGGIGACIFDVASSALNQYLRWITS